MWWWCSILKACGSSRVSTRLLSRASLLDGLHPPASPCSPWCHLDRRCPGLKNSNRVFRSGPAAHFHDAMRLAVFQSASSLQFVEPDRSSVTSSCVLSPHDSLLSSLLTTSNSHSAVIFTSSHLHISNSVVIVTSFSSNLTSHLFAPCRIQVCALLQFIERVRSSVIAPRFLSPHDWHLIALSHLVSFKIGARLTSTFSYLANSSQHSSPRSQPTSRLASYLHISSRPAEFRSVPSCSSSGLFALPSSRLASSVLTTGVS